MTDRPTCAFCQKQVAMPCGHSMQADFCSQKAPPSTPLPGSELATAPATEAAPAVAPQFTEDAAVALLRKATETPAPKPTSVQVGGDHYTKMPIQPITYIQANGLGFEEGTVIAYVSRWKDKGGIQDLQKARDMLDKQIAFLEAQEKQGLMEYLSALFKSV